MSPTPRSAHPRPDRGAWTRTSAGSRRAMLGVVFSALLPGLGACGGPAEPLPGDCLATVDTVRKSLNSYADSGIPVARFSFQQLYAYYPPACRREAGGPITLLITSTAPVALAFTYQVRGYDTNAHILWSFTDAITRIDPGQDVDVGIVARSSVRVDVRATAGFSDVKVVE